MVWQREWQVEMRVVSLVTSERRGRERSGRSAVMTWRMLGFALRMGIGPRAEEQFDIVGEVRAVYLVRLVCSSVVEGGETMNGRGANAAVGPG